MSPLGMDMLEILAKGKKPEKHYDIDGYLKAMVVEESLDEPIEVETIDEDMLRDRIRV